MKKKYLEIKVDSSVLFEERFRSSNYTENGIFEVSKDDTTELIFVDKSVDIAYCIGQIKTPLHYSIIERETIDPETVQQQELRECSTLASGVTENTLLKAMAIAQNPELAMQLIKED